MMKDHYSSLYINDDLWLIKETKWERSLQNIRESQFSLGNGYLGTRGVLEEIPYDAMPGTYIAGIYDRIGSQVAELVNLPNPFNFRFTIKGEKLDVVAMDVLKHRRILNMKKGLLIRHTLYQDSKKNRYDYQSLRFVSMHTKNIGVMQIVITPLDTSCVLDVNTGIDTSVFNAGVLSEGRKKHFRIKEVGQHKNAGYLAVETLEKKHTIIYWSGFYYKLGNKKIFAKENIFRIKLNKGQKIVFTKVFFVKNFPCDNNYADYKQECFKKFYLYFHKKFEDLLNMHIKAWEKLWKKADVIIEGTANLQQNLRFNIYHMLICAPIDEGISSIPARTLSGEGYRGHIFWDADIFLMPFYLFNFPEIAKNMLLYRYKRLEAARNYAKNTGFKGARFPWESADTGEEETPQWARDIDGTIVKIYTHKMEQHITSDIAYAVYKYYLATGDEEFMKRYGYEIIMETARFWASRVEYNPKKEKYEINHVIGPDEFHIDVNNNAYTNMMAKWNLITAYKLCHTLRKHNLSFYKKLKEKIELQEEEIKRWRRIASKISININKERIIEQFEGYFKLDFIPLTHTDENGIPILPPKLKTKDLKKTQLIKQADVLMLIYLLSDVFSPKTVLANFKYYLPRTVHKSSLSPAIHSIIACKCGELHTAYNLFNVSLRADISNLYNNTKEGIHAASLGGTWQAVIFGFAGVDLKEGTISINPSRLPYTWQKIIFSLTWRQYILKLEITNFMIKIKALSKKSKNLRIIIFNKPQILKTNKIYIFRRKRITRVHYYY